MLTTTTTMTMATRAIHVHSMQMWQRSNVIFCYVIYLRYIKVPYYGSRDSFGRGIVDLGFVVAGARSRLCSYAKNGNRVYQSFARDF